MTIKKQFFVELSNIYAPKRGWQMEIRVFEHENGGE